MRPHILSINQAQHINASIKVGSWELIVGSWHLSSEHVSSEDIEDLEGSSAVDNDISVDDEGEVVVGLILIVLKQQGLP